MSQTENIGAAKLMIPAYKLENGCKDSGQLERNTAGSRPTLPHMTRDPMEGQKPVSEFYITTTQALDVLDLVPVQYRIIRELTARGKIIPLYILVPYSFPIEILQLAIHINWNSAVSANDYIYV